jgi:hypothetical protein
MVARALAVVHTCIFDAWAAYDGHAVGTQLGGTLRRPAGERTEENKSKAASYAAYRALTDLYRGDPQKAQFDALMAELGYDPADASVDPSTPSGIGNRVSYAVINFRHGDGANQLANYADTSGYQPVNDPDHIVDPNRWQPLRVPDGHGGFVIQPYVAPHWGNVVPFALHSGSQFRPGEGPARVGHPGKYQQQAEEVLHYSAHLSDVEKVIAEYWADGPASELPPGHWTLFAKYVSERDGHALDADVKLFFSLTNAIFDASISCWDGKRAFDSVRPVTAVHFLWPTKKVRAWAGPGQGTQSIPGGNWEPYQAATVVTPPFPEYFSGHSTFSAAGAEILRRFTGSDAFGSSFTQAAGTSRVEQGTVPAQDVTLSWATFSDAADQAGTSRRYGGIHFVQGDLDGRAIGRQLAAQAWDKARAHITGA